MNELLREWKRIQTQCSCDPGARTGWIMIAGMLGLLLLGGIFLLLLI